MRRFAAIGVLLAGCVVTRTVGQHIVVRDASSETDAHGDIRDAIDEDATDDVSSDAIDATDIADDVRFHPLCPVEYERVDRVSAVLYNQGPRSSAGVIAYNNVTYPMGGCSTRSTGECGITICPIVTGDAGVPAGYPPYSCAVNIGDVTISNERGGSMLLRPARDTNEYSIVDAATVPGTAWMAGDHMLFHVEGGAHVGADARLPFPQRVTITDPPTPANPFEAWTLDLATGTTLRWNPWPSFDSVVATFTQTNFNSGQIVTVECRYPSLAGMGVVPPEALRDMIASAPFMDISFFVLESLEELAIAPVGVQQVFRARSIERDGVLALH